MTTACGMFCEEDDHCEEEIIVYADGQTRLAERQNKKTSNKYPRERKE